MAIDIKYIQSKFITLVGGLVGDKIYKYNGVQPAVFKAASFGGKTPPSPKYPFISVDVLPSINPFEHPVSEGWISETEYALQETRVIQFNIIVHGDGNTDINGIGNELRMKLKLSDYIYFMKDTLAAGYYNASQIVNTSVRLSDQYIESAQFTISYTVTDYTIYDKAESIEQVGVNTETHKDEEGRAGLYRGEDDPNPLQVEIELIPELP